MCLAIFCCRKQWIEESVLNFVCKFLGKNDIVVMAPPRYSLNLAPCDLLLFRKQKKLVKGAKDRIAEKAQSHIEGAYHQ